MVTKEFIEDILNKKRPTVKELKECIAMIYTESYSELQKKDEVIEKFRKSNEAFSSSDSYLRTRIFNMDSEITLLRNRNRELADKLSTRDTNKNAAIRILVLILVCAILASIAIFVV